MSAQLFPITIDNDETHCESIKWKQANTAYEIHTSVLRDLNLNILLPHCLAIRDKIITVVTNPAHLGPSFFRMFP